MKKIISLFKRDYEGTRLVYNEVVEGAEWVIKGEGVATEKIDGTSVLFENGKLFARFDAKKGKNPPIGFIPAQDPDPITGHWPGWVLVTDSQPQYKWHFKAFLGNPPSKGDGTYELIGIHVQGNPYHLNKDIFRKHGDKIINDVPRDYEGLKIWLGNHPEYEGIVWHRENGDLVKIKRRDFGFKWEGTPLK